MSYIAVDLDGTLATYNKGDYHKKGPTFIGEPIPAMVERVKGWLRDGYEVRILTARAVTIDQYEWMEPEEKEDQKKIEKAIADWCLEHIGQALPVTCVKDFEMIELWDDRAVAVETNTGRVLGGGRLENYQY